MKNADNVFSGNLPWRENLVQLPNSFQRFFSSALSGFTADTLLSFAEPFLLPPNSVFGGQQIVHPVCTWLNTAEHLTVTEAEKATALGADTKDLTLSRKKLQ